MFPFRNFRCDCGNSRFTNNKCNLEPVSRLLIYCSRISHTLFVINRLSKILNLNERRMLYYGLIYPHLSYGITVWGHSAKTLTRRIFVLQKRAVRYIAGLKHLESCRDSFRNLKILTVLLLLLLVGWD
jgi:hypothetical protein